MKGLTGKYLAPVLLDMHQRLEYNWQLDELVAKAAMLRSKFAVYFKDILGSSPMEYLTHWRITLAQTLLLKVKYLAQVTEDVGYSHNATQIRAFLCIVGKPPTDWLKLYKKRLKIKCLLIKWQITKMGGNSYSSHSFTHKVQSKISFFILYNV
ncbi:helix-turn-helix domain-containing protein [Bisgaard Taxon 46]